MTSEEQKEMKLQEMRNTTVGELLDMREQLNKAFEEKLGKKPKAGFSITFGTYSGNKVCFEGGYPDFGRETHAVTHSYENFETPQEAFDHTMQRIQEYNVPTKEDKIKALEDQLKMLKGEK